MSDNEPRDSDATADQTESTGDTTTDETMEATPVPDRRIGKYLIKHKLGQGAMGEAWLAQNPDLDIPVAIKTLPTYLIEREPGFVKRFFKEAKTAARINHSNAVHVYDCGVDDDVHYIVMEYVDGGTVRQLQEKAGGPLPLSQAIEIIYAVTEALREAARFHIIHRDIKPDNIMVDSRGTPKLADLGLAKQLDALEDTGMTGTGVAIGTPKYIAPEQVQDAKNVDARADIYSLGVTFYHLVTGDVPFSASSSFEMMLKHVEEQLPHPQEKRPDLPDDVCAVICKMTEKSADRRYQTADELAQDLLALKLAHADETAAPTSAAGAAPAPRKKSTTPILAALALVLIAAVTVVVLRPWAPKNAGRADPGGAPGRPPDKPPAGDLPKPVSGKDYNVPAAELELVALPAGSFKMGAADGEDDEKPQHTVSLTRPFWIGKYEVTWKQFKAFTDATGFRTHAERSESSMVWEGTDSNRGRWVRKDDISWRNVFEGEDRAVVCVNWNDAMAFCKWLTETEKDAARLPDGYEYRLPTEAEWEYACRAGTQTKYFFGDHYEDLEQYAWTAHNTQSKVHRVGDVKPNPWGLYDMHGNAAEWCLDSALNVRYRVTTSTYVEGIKDPLSLLGDEKIYRGGSWLSRGHYCRAAGRSAVEPTHHAVVIGFRVVLGPVLTDRTAKADTLPKFGRQIKVPKVELELLPIRAGYFKMGSEKGKADEKPVHQVTLAKPFWMAKYETTHGQFKTFADTAGYRSTSEKDEATTVYDPSPGWRRLRWKKDVTWRTVFDGDRRAVCCVSWSDVMAFCKWLTGIENGAGRVPPGYEYRLPTEAEWEYACRAGSSTNNPYYWGSDKEKIYDYAWTGWGSRDRIRVVGDKKPNRWDLHDMLGNAGEWCLDAADYKDAMVVTRTYRDKVTDPLNTSGAYRIIRGGSWIAGADDCRMTARSVAKLGYHGAATGFRIVLAPRMSHRVPRPK